MKEERIGAPAAAPETREGEGEYEDLMAVMAERLEAEEFMRELQAGFRVLAAEGEGGLITAESLRRRAGEVLGLQGMTAAEAEAMVREGDLDGDGALGEAEFCVLMLRLSPTIMADARDCLADAIAAEIAGAAPPPAAAP